MDFITERKPKNGAVFTVSLTVAPLQDKEGHVFEFTGVTRDITDSQKTEELLRKVEQLKVVGQHVMVRITDRGRHT